MNPERFAAELPALFDDFPRSEHPGGRRFDDVIDAVPNLAMENNLALVNLAVSLLDSGESYVEAGTYMGASLIAAARGNEGADLVAIDNFGFGPMEVAGRSLPAASRAALEANLDRFGVRGATILEGDALELLRGNALVGRSVGVFYYDACHSYDAQLEALRLAEPYLAEPALVIVDDSDWEQVGRAMLDYLAGQPRARLLVEIGGSGHGQPQWWEGMQALSWSGAP